MKAAVKVYADGRMRCRTEAAWQRQRKAVYKREDGLCEKCMTYAPLHNTEDAYAGHAHHIHGRAQGNDHIDVLMWLCGRCHAKEHIPDKVIPAKPKFLIQPHVVTDRHLEELIGE